MILALCIIIMMKTSHSFNIINPTVKPSVVGRRGGIKVYAGTCMYVHSSHLISFIHSCIHHPSSSIGNFNFLFPNGGGQKKKAGGASSSVDQEALDAVALLTKAVTDRKGRIG